MKPLFRISSGLLLLIAIITIYLVTSAQTLPVDSRKKEIQNYRSWEALDFIPAADTTWQKVTLPQNTMDVTIMNTGVHDMSVKPNNTYKKGDTAFLLIPPDKQVTLPQWRKNDIYIRKTAANDTVRASLIFLKM